MRNCFQNLLSDATCTATPRPQKLTRKKEAAKPKKESPLKGLLTPKKKEKKKEEKKRSDGPAADKFFDPEIVDNMDDMRGGHLTPKNEAAIAAGLPPPPEALMTQSL